MPSIRSSLFGKLPKGINCERISIQNIKADWITPDGSTKEKVILYFHGGGYVIGTIEAHRPIVSKFVFNTKIPALLFDYRLAPENPFPAGLEYTTFSKRK